MDIKLVMLFLLGFYFIPCNAQKDKKSPNVLFIFVDDLRPDLGCYGNSIVKSPNIDKLASESRIFKNHYVQVPTCGASRYNILTGLLPRKEIHLSNNAIRDEISQKKENEKPETFIHHLKRNGYYTVGMGKISHYIDGLYPYTGNPNGAPPELPYSWDEFMFNSGKWGTGWNAFFAYADGSNRQSRDKQVKPYEHADVSDEGYPDGLTANLAVDKLKDLSKLHQPFFLGVGFFKPHLPFNAPKKYWDLYDESKIKLTPSPNIPRNVNPESLHNNTEFNQYLLGEEKPTLDQPASDEYARKIKHSYYAAVSYVDAQIGKVIDELDRLNLTDDTIIVLWGDHGWQLGDHREWGKHTIFEKALNSPLIIKVPGMKKPGVSTQNIVSTIDIYPTLMELCNVKMPYETDGKSLVRLLQDPYTNKWDNRAYSYFRKGISLRTDKYRYTKYFRSEQPVIELYDHKTDPNENINVAEKFPGVVKRLDKIWKKGDTGIYDKEPSK